MQHFFHLLGQILTKISSIHCCICTTYFCICLNLGKIGLLCIIYISSLFYLVIFHYYDITTLPTFFREARPSSSCWRNQPSSRTTISTWKEKTLYKFFTRSYFDWFIVGRHTATNHHTPQITTHCQYDLSTLPPPRFPYMSSLNFPYLSKLINNPIAHDPSRPAMLTKLP